jgi:hypothetical protein
MRLKAPPADLLAWRMPNCGSISTPGARAPPPPARGGISVRESGVPSLCSTFSPRVSPREPHYIASPRELLCELCAVCPADRTRCYGR